MLAEIKTIVQWKIWRKKKSKEYPKIKRIKWEIKFYEAWRINMKTKLQVLISGFREREQMELNKNKNLGIPER